MTVILILLELLLSFTALVCGLYAVATLLERKSRFATRALISSVIAVVLVIAALICTLFFPKGNMPAGDTQTLTPNNAGATTSTTVTTASTTQMTTKTSTASNSGEMLVNIPIEGDDAANSLATLNQLCKDYGNTLSFYYRDLETGYSIEFRADRAYQSASVIKAPYIKYLLASGVDGSQTLTLAASDKQGGSGVVDKEPAGTVFTVNQLMENAIRYSDNTAYYMLNKKFGFAGFNEYAKTLGITANANNNCVLSYPRPRFGYLSARDIGLYMQDIAKYLETGSDGAQRLKTWMTSTAEERQLVDAYRGKYTVAHKYGDTKNIEWAFHDGAIVYADKPFVLAVATSLEPFTDESIKVYHALAECIDVIHTAYHTP